MNTSSSRFRRVLSAYDGADATTGEFVKWGGRKGVGIVWSVETNGFAWISWGNGRRDYLPLAVLRHVKHRGERFDRRAE